MRVGIRRISSQRLAQPVGAPLMIAFEDVRVPEIEEVVGIAAVGVRGFGQVVNRRSILRIGTAVQLREAEVVEDL